jgi:ferredoxin--NADP+ reductase
MGSSKLGTVERPLWVAIIGAGPAAYFTAEALFKQEELDVRVDMFNRLPTPYGLVRDGVAPDHQSIKAVTRKFEKISHDARFRYFGNVTIGEDVHRDDLLRLYDQVVYAVGTPTDKEMGIPGEDLEGSHSATEFVWWYNGHPDFTDSEFDLSAERAVVVGIGNVALDVARILASDPAELGKTDIADHALEALRSSRVREIIVLGRRGPAQAAFSSVELKEFGQLEGAGVAVDPADLELDEESRRLVEEQRGIRRNCELLEGYAAGGAPSNGGRTVAFRFLVSPVELMGDGDGRLETVRIERNRLVLTEDGSMRPRGSGEYEDIEAGLVFRSIGYRGIPLPGVPFHDRWGIIPNQGGRVVDEDGRRYPREYVSGWCKRGPSGVIGTNKPDAAETAAAMVEDAAGVSGELSESRAENAIEALLVERDVDYVTFRDWEALDEFELSRGEAQGRPRVKVCHVTEMLEVIHAARERRGSPAEADRSVGVTE